jgi:hypothetical protein
MSTSTLLLDQSAWDLVLDSSGNIAMATAPYATAQDVASAVKTFLGEVYYDTKQGIPYWTEVLGELPPASLLTGLIEDAANTQPGVTNSVCTITSFDARSLSGQITWIDPFGVPQIAFFTGGGGE